MRQFSEQDFDKRWETGRRALFWAGTAMIVLGFNSFVFLVVSSLVVEQVVGWLFLFAGLAGLVAAFAVRRTSAGFGLNFISSSVAFVAVKRPFTPWG